MDALLKRWTQLKKIEAFQHGPEGLLRRSSAHWPVAQEETLAIPEWSPLVDISEDENEYLIKAELPEVKSWQGRIRNWWIHAKAGQGRKA